MARKGLTLSVRKDPMSLPSRGRANSSRAPETAAVGEPALAAWRVAVFYALTLGVLLIFVARLINLQVMQHSTLAQYADENRYSRVSLPAARGIIYDRNGVALARNVPSFNIVITPAYFPDLEDNPAQAQAIFQRLSELTGVPVTVPGSTPKEACAGGRGIRDLYEEFIGFSPYTPAPVACDVPKEVAMVIREGQSRMPGVSVQAIPVREYPTGSLTAHVVGYPGPIPASEVDYYTGLGFSPSEDKIGYAGIEAAFQDQLAGRNGQKLVEKDVAGEELRTVGEPEPPISGQNIVLTLDTRLQAAAEAALTSRINYLNNYSGKVISNRGAVIAINPQTGEILAMVSWPGYDNNLFARFIPADYYDQLVNDPLTPLLNQTISGVYPPGSVFKLATASGALQEGVIDPNRYIETPGKITITDRYFPNDAGRARDFVDWNREGFGRLNFLYALANSSNVYFYKAGGGYQNEVPDGGLGIDRLGYYARALGYDQTTGIELPGESAARIPTRDWKRLTLGENWATGDTYIASVGQGYVTATPMQVLLSAATLANGGRMMQPTLVKEIRGGEGNVIKPFTPTVRWDVTQGYYDEKNKRTTTISPHVIQLIQQGMRQVIIDGTGSKYVHVEGVAIAGKSGTAEYCDNIAQQKNLCQFGNWPEHAWFVGYGPYENPEIMVLVFVYNGGEGSITAGPIVSEVLNAYFDLKAIDAGQPTQGQ